MLNIKNLFHKKKQFVSSGFVNSISYLTEKDINNNKIFCENIQKHIWKTPPKTFMFFSIYSTDFLAGGFKTHLDLIQYIYNKFNAKIYLSFFPAVSQEQNEYFEKQLKLHYPNLKIEFVNLETANKIETDVCISLNLATIQAIKYNKCKEKYIHAMDYEALFYQSGTDSTIYDFIYSQGLNVFTNSIGLQQIYQNKNPYSKIFRYIPGIDEIYHPGEKRKNKDKYKIVVYARPNTPRNAFSLIVPVIQGLKEKLKDKIEIILVGEKVDLEYFSLEGKCVNLGRLNSLEELADLYRRCDFGISFITTPTFSYLHLQIMASGVCLVTNDQIGVKNFLKDGDNAIVVPPIPPIIIEKIIDYIKNPKKMTLIRNNALKTIKNYTWKNCFDSISDFIIGVND